MTTLELIEIIQPIIENIYGSTPHTRALALHLARRVDAVGLTESQIEAVCYAFVAMPSTARLAAERVTEALNAQRPTQEAILTAEELERVASDLEAHAARLRARAGALRRA